MPLTDLGRHYQTVERIEKHLSRIADSLEQEKRAAVESVIQSMNYWLFENGKLQGNEVRNLNEYLRSKLLAVREFTEKVKQQLQFHPTAWDKDGTIWNIVELHELLDKLLAEYEEKECQHDWVLDEWSEGDICKKCRKVQLR